MLMQKNQFKRIHEKVLVTGYETNKITYMYLRKIKQIVLLEIEYIVAHLICYFFPNPGRILQVLIFNGYNHCMSMLAGFCHDLAENDELWKKLVREVSQMLHIAY